MAALDRIPAPALPPGSCLVDQRHTDPLGFFDLGGSIDGHGALYLCGTCVVELARKMRWSPPELLENERRANYQLRQQVAAEREHADELKAVLAGPALDLIKQAIDRQGMTTEADGGTDPDPGQDAAERGGGGGGAGGEPAGRRRGDRGAGRRTAAQGHRAPAGPGAGDLGGGALAPVDDLAVPLA